MTAKPHALTEAFPDQIEMLRKLRSEDAHFAKIADAYDAANEAVWRAERDLAPTDDFHMADLRKERMRLRDEIARLLREASAKP